MVDFTVAIPCYNEEESLENAVRKNIEKFHDRGEEVHIIISEDGSTDRTVEIGKALEEEFPNVEFIRWSNQRRGKGASVSDSIRSAKTPYVIFMDADLSNDIDYIGCIIKGLREGYDLIIGSRAHRDSIVKRPILRAMASRCFNFLVRILFKMKIRDTQSGFKGFRRESALAVMDQVENTSWFWDTEMIVRLIRAGFRVIEAPTKFIDFRPNTKVNVVRDSKTMAKDAIGLWMKLRQEDRK